MATDPANRSIPGLLAPLAGLLLLLAGCATPLPNLPADDRPSLPPDAFVTQRAVLTARGRQFTLNGYLSVSAQGGLRLRVTENFGALLADVLIRADGTVQVKRESKVFPAAWIRRYLAADAWGLFGVRGRSDCPARRVNATHYVIQRRWYQLDLRILEIKPGLQPAVLFEPTPPGAP